MGNCKSGLVLGYEIVDISDEENPGDLIGCLQRMLRIDGDLEDEGQIDVIINRAVLGKVINDIEVVDEIFDEVFAELSNQEFWGSCDYGIIQVPGLQAVSISWAVGGNED